MDLHVLLVDDEQLCLDSMLTALHSFPYVQISGMAKNSNEAVSILRQEPVDLVFLDIEMGSVSGFDLARHIQTVYPDIMVVFLTGHVDFALDGYEYQPLDFLIKPVDLMRLERVLLRALDEMHSFHSTALSSKEPVQIGLSVDGGFEIIDVNSLLYIEKTGRKVFLVSTNGTRYRSYDTLQKLLGIFEPYGFFRCHQSFLVRLSAIRGIHLDASKNSYNIELSGSDAVVPLSRNRYNELKELLQQRGIKFF